MTRHLRIDFVSDVTCPWCAVGLASLEQALARVAPDIEAELHFQPFELNPRMGPEGQDAFEHLNEKYGTTREQQAQGRAAIRERGLQVAREAAPHTVEALIRAIVEELRPPPPEPGADEGS